MPPRRIARRRGSCDAQGTAHAGSESMNLPGRVLDHGGLLDALESVHRQSATLTRGFGIVLFSIDRFRLINSRFGPAQADEVLRRVGTAARQALPRKAAVGRWGGDEFLCLLGDADVEMNY